LNVTVILTRFEYIVERFHKIRTGRKCLSNATMSCDKWTDRNCHNFLGYKMPKD